MRTLLLMLVICVVSARAQQQWQQILEIDEGSFSNVTATSQDSVFVILRFSRVLDTLQAIQCGFRSVDGGKQWKPMLWKSTTLGKKQFQEVLFTSKNTGFIVGYQGEQGNSKVLLLNTINGGETWEEVELPYQGEISDIDFPTATTGYIVGKGEHLKSLMLKTTDGGRTWSRILCKYPELLSVSFRDSLIGMRTYDDYSDLVEYRYGLELTTDGGDIWNNISIKNKPQNAAEVPIEYTVHFADNSTWVVGCLSVCSYRSFNDGTSWELISGSPNNSSFHTFGFSRNWWVATGSYYRTGLINSSTDYGNTWVQDSISQDLLSSGVVGVTLKGNIGYAITFRRVLKTLQPNISAVKEIVEKPTLQLYPNPNYSILYLNYMASSQNRTLFINDLLGNIALSFLIPLETTQTTLTLPELPAGTYFCRLGEEVRAIVVAR